MRIACRTLITECGIHAPPVPLRTLFNRLGIRIVRRDTPGAATLRAKAGGLEVWLGTDAARWRRERFTLAHELAHVLLLSGSNQHVSDPRNGIDSGEYEEYERLCNLGAAELLMPSAFVLEAVGQVGVSAGGLQRLYDSFLVSYESLLYRLAEVLPSSAVILWRKYARHGSEPTTLRVLTSYQRYRSSRSAPWLPKGTTAQKHIRPDIVTQALEKETAIFSPNLTLGLARREEQCFGVATVLPQPRSLAVQMPLFDGHRVLDESALNIHVVLLIGQQSMHSNATLWKTIQELIQC
jgi:hypothetical protein